MQYYALAILGCILYFLTKTLYSLYTNVQLARASGIPYTISPIYGYNMFWLVTSPLYLKLLHRLPSFLTEPWIHITPGDWSWQMSYTPFGSAMFNSDTFLIVSPGGIIMPTADADVINEIVTRKADFPKPIEMYGSLDIFGKNVVSVEGGEWRRQRRLLTPQFNEKSNGVVWKESLFQAGKMLESWKRGSVVDSGANGRGEDGKADGGKVNGFPEKKVKNATKSGIVISELGKDCMRLSLHVISRAGFDVRCLWPGAKDSEKAMDEGSMDSNIVPEGHKMSYTSSLETLLHRILPVLILPDWFLRLSPWSLLRQAGTSYKEWGLYMSEIYDRKADMIQHTKSISTDDEGLDLMGAMIRHSGLIEGTPNHGKRGVGMSQREVMGNSFVLFLAGHETAANSIHFCVLYLAMRPDLQRKLQAELSQIFGSTPPSTWSYETHIPTLFTTLTGAIMNEQLRLIPPVVMIPKSTPASSPQPLIINGKPCIVPPKTHIALDSVAVHRNPKYWPHGPARSEEDGGPVHESSNLENDLEEFKPERWFVTSDDSSSSTTVRGREGNKDDEATATDEDNEFEISEAPTSTSHKPLFHPQRGAYIPFSEGARSCIGRRFAQVEILATLAVLFHTHSFELCTDGFASEEEVSKMGREERSGVYGEVRQEVERKMREEMGTVITLQFRKGGVRLRVCERGGELFF
ncbi:cytochrome P450 [Tothia fuscella]|uniref:Cytochrome P450 n=1 Tax=Tothia fuscella TaxID=1048955 RepID=A0A9P4NRP3_9PEZI|nr:cytochrome P450 [Tothia fuscella]